MSDAVNTPRAKYTIQDVAINPGRLKVLISIHTGIIIALLGMLFVLIVMIISYLSMTLIQERSYQKREDIITAPPPEALQVYKLPEISIMTLDADPHMLKVQVSIGYEKSEQLEMELENRKVQILHIMHIILQGKKYSELKTESDRIALAEEIKAHVNVILTGGKIKEVFLMEFLLQ